MKIALHTLAPGRAVAACALAFALGSGASFNSYAQSYKLKDLELSQVRATPTVAGAPTGAVYLSVANRGKSPDRLIGGNTPRAKRVELHTMNMTGDVMRMREVDGMELKPGETLAMSPGMGNHLMLVGLTAPLKVGEKFPMNLRFEKSGTLEIEVAVEQASTPPAHGHMH